MKKITVSTKKHNNTSDELVKLIRRVETAIESIPPNRDELFKIICEMNNPNYKYPLPKKCCDACPAEEEGKKIKTIIETIKTFEFIDDIEEIKSLFGKIYFSFYGVVDIYGKDMELKK